MSVSLLRSVFREVFDKDGVKFVDCVMDVASSGEDQLQSQIVFVSAVVQSADTRTTIPLVVKFEHHLLQVRTCLNTKLQFYNEVLMYTEILPFINRQNIIEELFPNCYHGVGVVEEAKENKNIVILQDLRPLGYKLTKERVYMDYGHLDIFMNKLGKLHALSYAAKKEFPDKFFKLASRLQESFWTETCYFRETVIACMRRAVSPLIEQGRHVEILQSLLDRVNLESLKTIMKNLISPEEPSAVICHGDFCRNNILIKYDDAGKPIDVKFFDIARARYSSPAVDITLLLLLNGCGDLRRAHWDELLEVYYQSLSTAIPGLEVPALEDIREEVRLKAFYGFVHCSFFLPMMLFDSPLDMIDVLTYSNADDMAALQSKWGEEEGTKVLSAMIEDLIDFGCLVAHNKYIFPI